MYVCDDVQILSLLIISRPLQNKVQNVKQIIPQEDGPHAIRHVEYLCGVSFNLSP
jgi:hypothetical protein